MSQISSKITAGGQGLVIAVEGYFNMAVHGDFRRAYEGQPKFERYAVSLQHCKGIDSAGLGLLLLLRDYAGVEQEHLLISHCPPEVKTVLQYSNFDQIFTIS